MFLLLVLSLGTVSVLPASASLPLALDTQSPTVTLGTGVTLGEAAWADFNNDSLLDLVLTGRGPSSNITTLFWNNGTVHPPTNPSLLQALETSSADWGDYDNDGYLDLVLTGHYGVNSAFTGIYHNESVASERRLVLKTQLTGVYDGTARWGDYDYDGALDLLVSGKVPGSAVGAFTPLTRIYHNDGGGNFSDAGFTGLVGLAYSAAAWGNFDNDSYLDFAISGQDASGTPRLYVYRNQSGKFSSSSTMTIERPSSPSKIGMQSGTVNWIDYNRDRLPELLVSGNVSAGGIEPATVLYSYNGTTKKFSEISGTGLPNIWSSSVSIGDYDNDGYSDILLNGRTTSNRPTAIYHNDNGSGSFSKVSFSPDLPEGSDLSVAFGDFGLSSASDHTLDALVSGFIPAGSSAYETYIYTSKLSGSEAANTPPSQPTIRAACWNNSTSDPRLTFYWNSASDDHNNSSTLTYNLRVGTGGDTSQDVLSPSADFSSGYLRLPHPGNVGPRSYHTLRTLSTNTSYSWSVQAVDTSYAGSLFSTSGLADVGTRVALDDSGFSVNEDGTLTIPVADLLANDNAAYAPLSLFTQNSPSHSGSTLYYNSTTQSLIYTPAPHWNGSDTFLYYPVGKNAYCSPATVSITVNEVNYPPTAITLSPSSLVEGLASAAKVGTLNTTDLDGEETFTYTLLDASGGIFELRSGNEIWAVQPLDFAHGPYTIRVQSTDSGAGHLSVTQDLTITPIQNHAPTAVNLSNLVVPMGKDAGYTVGTLTTVDPDANDAFTYSLYPTSTSADNGLFAISGDKLTTRQKFTTPATYTIHVLSSDMGGKTVVGDFTIQVIDPNPQISCEASASGCSTFTSIASGQYSLTVNMSEDGLNDLDQPDAFALTLKASPALGTGALTWMVMPSINGGSTALSASSTQPGAAVQVTYTPKADWNSTYTGTDVDDVFVIYVSDASGSTATVSVKVHVTPVNDPPQIGPVSGALFYEPGSGQHTLQITGLKVGPDNENSQTLTLGIATSLPCGPITDAVLSAPVGGSSTLTLTIGEIPADQLSTYTFPLVLYVDDGQPYHHRTELTLQVSLDHKQFYLPIIGK